MAESILSSIRSSDFMGRIGGDELMVVFPETGIEEAQRHRTPHLQQPAGGNHRTLRHRQRGVAEWRPGESSQDALKRADAALYQSKNRGRSRVSIEA